MEECKRTALDLSGGGIRAMLFHLGVLKYLAECKSLEAIDEPVLNFVFEA
mgnify:CR=1 FL=1